MEIKKFGGEDSLSFREIADKIAEAYGHEQIILPKDEYARVMSEFNTNMSDEERTHRLVTKAIGGYYYTIINLGFNDYIIVNKSAIASRSQEIWGDYFEE